MVSLRQTVVGMTLIWDALELCRVLIFYRNFENWTETPTLPLYFKRNETGLWQSFVLLTEISTKTFALKFPVFLLRMSLTISTVGKVTEGFLVEINAKSLQSWVEKMPICKNRCWQRQGLCRSRKRLGCFIILNPTHVNFCGGKLLPLSSDQS